MKKYAILILAVSSSALWAGDYDQDDIKCTLSGSWNTFSESGTLARTENLYIRMTSIKVLKSPVGHEYRKDIVHAQVRDNDQTKEHAAEDMVLHDDYLDQGKLSFKAWNGSRILIKRTQWNTQNWDRVGNLTNYAHVVPKLSKDFIISMVQGSALEGRITTSDISGNIPNWEGATIGLGGTNQSSFYSKVDPVLPAAGQIENKIAFDRNKHQGLIITFKLRCEKTKVFTLDEYNRVQKEELAAAALKERAEKRKNQIRKVGEQFGSENFECSEEFAAAYKDLIKSVGALTPEEQDMLYTFEYASSDEMARNRRIFNSNKCVKRRGF